MCLETETLTIAQRMHGQDPLDLNRVLYVLTVADLMQALDDIREDEQDQAYGDPTPDFEEMGPKSAQALIERAQSDFETWMGSSSDWVDHLKDSVRSHLEEYNPQPDACLCGATDNLYTTDQGLRCPKCKDVSDE